MHRLMRWLGLAWLALGGVVTGCTPTSPHTTVEAEAEWAFYQTKVNTLLDTQAELASKALKLLPLLASPTLPTAQPLDSLSRSMLQESNRSAQVKALLAYHRAVVYEYIRLIDAEHARRTESSLRWLHSARGRVQWLRTRQALDERLATSRRIEQDFAAITQLPQQR
jgi:hypothetical protein